MKRVWKGSSLWMDMSEHFHRLWKREPLYINVFFARLKNIIDYGYWNIQAQLSFQHSDFDNHSMGNVMKQIWLQYMQCIDQIKFLRKILIIYSSVKSISPPSIYRCTYEHVICVSSKVQFIIRLLNWGIVRRCTLSWLFKFVSKSIYT